MGAMGVHEFMSLDGVVDAPTWTFEYGFTPEMEKTLGRVTEHSRGILLGRNTYEAIEPAWSQRTVEDDPGAPFFNDTTKYVVSGTDGLVDDLQLLVYPLTRGSGPRLFTEGAEPATFELGACESYDNGVVYLNYRPQA